MKKVLIITYYWPPAGGGGVQRWVKFVKYLRDYGWEPVVFTAANADYPIIDPSLEAEIPDDIVVLKQAIWEPYQWYKKISGKRKTDKIDANFLSQGKKMGWKDKLAVWIRGNFFIPDARVLWVGPSVAYLKKYISKYPVDAIISTGPPHSCHLIAYPLKKKYGLPWVVDYRDPWTQIDYFNDLHLTFPARKYHENLEKKVLNNCDTIVTVGKTMAEELKSISGTKSTVITNGFDDSDRTFIETLPDLNFTITYIGTMNESRNPEVLWRALEALRQENHALVLEVQIKLVGKPEEFIKRKVQSYGLEEMVRFEGYVSHKEAIAQQNAASLLLLVINRTSNNKSILTGKIFEYLASGRPVICIGPDDGDAAEIIRTSGAGTMVDYEDVAGMKKLITESYHKFKMGTLFNHKTQIENYSRKNLTGQLADILNNLTDKSKWQ